MNSGLNDTAALPLANKATLRNTANGKIIGFTEVETGAHAWLGIPYAQPPLGELRWRAPRPLNKSWDGERTALAYGPIASQQEALVDSGIIAGNTFTGSNYIGSEDCLYLNIWSPPMAANAIPEDERRLPVMVWIHGGGNIIGSGVQRAKGKLAVTQEVILVTLNYRLGAFGWLSHPAIRELGESPEDQSGNFGTLDIIQALQWVRDNIAHFGGNPDNVTIFGLSAGGWNVFSLLCSPLAAGLFHRAIAQGGWPKSASLTHAENFVDDVEPGHPQSSNELLLQLLQTDEPTRDRAAAKKLLKSMSSKTVMAYLRRQSYKAIERAYFAIQQQQIEPYFPREVFSDIKLGGEAPECSVSAPKIFRDGWVVSSMPFDKAVTAGQYNQVPVMLGTTRDESKLFQLLKPEWVVVTDGKRIINNPDQYELANEYQSKLWKAVGADEPAATLAGQQSEPIFNFRFDWGDWPSVDGEDIKALLGSVHGLESTFIFGSKKLPSYVEADRPEDTDALSDAMMSYWSEFAYRGHPGCGRQSNLPEWRPWQNNTAITQKMMILDTESNGGIRMSGDQTTRQEVIQHIFEDPRVDGIEQQRHLCRDLLSMTHTFFIQEDYHRLQQRFGQCEKINKLD